MIELGALLTFLAPLTAAIAVLWAKVNAMQTRLDHLSEENGDLLQENTELENDLELVLWDRDAMRHRMVWYQNEYVSAGGTGNPPPYDVPLPVRKRRRQRTEESLDE